jgi:hypothetical protein
MVNVKAYIAFNIPHVSESILLTQLCKDPLNERL